MKTDRNLTFNYSNSKPRYLTRYQNIFKELLNDFNFFNTNSESENNSTKKNFFFIKNTENDPIKKNLNSTRYQLLTGKKIENPYKSDNYKNNTFKRQNKSYHQSSSSTIDSSSLRFTNGNNKTLKNFKKFLRNTDSNNNIGFHYSNNKNYPTRNFGNNNNFIEKLHNALPEYTNLSNKGQSFLKGNNKISEFSSLKNKLK
jgi:hypothetical protein